MAHKVDKTASKQSFGSSVPTKDSIIQKLILRPVDIELVSAKNADTEYATKGQYHFPQQLDCCCSFIHHFLVTDVFATDAVISKCSSWQVAEKELEPWDEPMVDGGDISILEGDSSVSVCVYNT